MTSRQNSVIRESIQNSLDAQEDQSRPVDVNFNITQLPTSYFAADSLIQSLSLAIESPHNDDAHKAQFKRGRNLLKRAGSGTVKCLNVTDRNTTGADDIPRKNFAPSKWEALTKGTGSNAKDQRDAAGSFGLGKHAAFATTDLRTVLYAAAWPSKNELHRRFQGKTILVSHKHLKGDAFRSVGYLGASDFEPLRDNEVPRQFRLNEPGTALYIPGFESNHRWRDSSMRIVMDDFFHSIVHNKLQVMVDGKQIKSNSLDRFTDLLESRTINFISVSRSQPVAEITIPGIGRIALRIKVYEDPSENTKREIALVRDAGMMITDQPRNMSLSGLSSFPGHWRGFTTIIECLSEGNPSLLRDSESPEHNKISVDYISDPTRRKEARTRLRELGQWCREEIRQRTEPQFSSEDNASEIAKFLPIGDDGTGNGDVGDRGSHREIVTTPIQSNRPPRRVVSPTGASRPRAVPGDGDAPSDPPDNPDTPPDPKPPRPPRRHTVVDTPDAFGQPRFRVGSKNHTHSVIVTFDNPGQTLHDLRLVAIGEDGQNVPMGVREAYAGDIRLHVNKDVVQSVDNGDADRWSVEFITREPVLNKTFHIRGTVKQDEA